MFLRTYFTEFPIGYGSGVGKTFKRLKKILKILGIERTYLQIRQISNGILQFLNFEIF